MAETSRSQPPIVVDVAYTEVPRAAQFDSAQQAPYADAAVGAASPVLQAEIFAPAPAAAEPVPAPEASGDARSWADVPGATLATSLKHARDVLWDPRATPEQHAAAQQVWEAGRREHARRVGEPALAGMVEVVSPVQPEVLKPDRFEEFYGRVPTETLERFQTSLLASVRESMVELRDNGRRAPGNPELGAERAEGRARNLKDYDRLATNLLSIQRVLTRRQLPPGAAEPFRGRTPEGITVPTRLDPAVVKQFADELFAAYGEDAYGLVRSMVAGTNVARNPEEGPSGQEERQRIAERTMLMLDVQDQMLRDSRPGYKRQGLEAQYASVQSHATKSRQ